jgi:hypothetical protein
MTDIFKNRTLPSEQAIKKLEQTEAELLSSKLKKHKMAVQKKKFKKFKKFKKLRQKRKKSQYKSTQGSLALLR